MEVYGPFWGTRVHAQLLFPRTVETRIEAMEAPPFSESIRSTSGLQPVMVEIAAALFCQCQRLRITAVSLEPQGCPQRHLAR